MKPRLVLLRPPMIVPRWAHASPICPPLGLAYVAAAARGAGWDVSCVDALGEAPFRRWTTGNGNFVGYGLPPEELVARAGNCDALGISVMFSHDWPTVKNIFRDLRPRMPHAVLIAGGEHLTALPEFCLSDCPELDIGVLGEGEATIVDLLKAIESGSATGVAGTVYRHAGNTRIAPGRRRLEPLESIPRPAWDLLPMENYLANGLGYGVNPGRTLPLVASRGCPFQCTFCSSPRMWTTRWRARNPDDVLDEMQDAIKRYGVRNFDLYDLTAIVRKDWVVEFAGKILERGWDITWQMPAGTRSEALDEECLRLMRSSGQRNISYAPESGSPATLRRIKKNVDLDRMTRSISAALREGMNVKLNMIMGFPHESDRHLLETAFFLARMAALGVHDAYIACFSPYPGSELFEELRGSGAIGALDSDYFLALTSYSDLRYSRSYAPRLSSRRLSFYRLGSMALFYAISYLLHPSRILRLIFNFIRGREESRLDVALRSIKDRFRPGRCAAATEASAKA